MDYSENKQEGINQTNNASPKSKKFVFAIDSENIEYIESLNVEDRNVFINDIIYHQMYEDYRQAKVQNIKTTLTNIGIGALIIIIVIPLLFALINFSIDSTQNSYNDMQVKFQKYYKVKKRKY